jgi:hypothetical protein
VLAPTVDFFQITTSTVNVCQDGQYLTQPGRWLALFEPGQPRRYGRTWDAQVQAPFKRLRRGWQQLGAGQVGFIQVRL